VIERYSAELRDYQRIYPFSVSSARKSEIEKFYAGQLRLLNEIRFDRLSQAGKVDYLLLRSRLVEERRQLQVQAKEEAELTLVISFQQTIIGLEEARRRMQTIDGQKSAIALEKLVHDIAAATDHLSGAKANSGTLDRAAHCLEQLRGTLHDWYDFYVLYDPQFVWWTEALYKKVDEVVEAHPQLLHETLGVGGVLRVRRRFWRLRRARRTWRTRRRKWQRAPPSDHLVQQFRPRVRNHHLVHQHPFLAHHLRARIHCALHCGHIARHGHERLAAQRHRQPNLDQLHIRRLHRGVRAFNQRCHRKGFHHPQRRQLFYLRRPADRREDRFV
jgi:hypothetical protein